MPSSSFSPPYETTTTTLFVVYTCCCLSRTLTDLLTALLQMFPSLQRRIRSKETHTSISAKTKQLCHHHKRKKDFPESACNSASILQQSKGRQKKKKKKKASPQQQQQVYGFATNLLCCILQLHRRTRVTWNQIRGKNKPMQQKKYSFNADRQEQSPAEDRPSRDAMSERQREIEERGSSSLESFLSFCHPQTAPTALQLSLLSLLFLCLKPPLIIVVRFLSPVLASGDFTLLCCCCCFLCCK